MITVFDGFEVWFECFVVDCWELLSEFFGSLNRVCAVVGSVLCFRVLFEQVRECVLLRFCWVFQGFVPWVDYSFEEFHGCVFLGCCWVINMVCCVVL